MARAKRQPTTDEQKRLGEVLDNAPTEVSVGDGTVNVKWLKNGTLAKLRKITLGNHKDELMVSAKCAAAILLDGYWKIKFFWWLKWRWLYYVKQWGDAECRPIIDEGKKKVPAVSYYVNIISLTEIMYTIMAITRQQADRIKTEILG